MDRTIQYFQDNRKIGKLQIADNLIFSKIRDPGCRESIRLVKAVCLNQFSDFIIVKNCSKSNLYIEFVEKSRLNFLVLPTCLSCMQPQLMSFQPSSCEDFSLPASCPVWFKSGTRLCSHLWCASVPCKTNSGDFRHI